jgi:hypothetical protein
MHQNSPETGLFLIQGKEIPIGLQTIAWGHINDRLWLFGATGSNNREYFGKSSLHSFVSVVFVGGTNRRGQCWRLYLIGYLKRSRFNILAVQKWMQPTTNGRCDVLQCCRIGIRQASANIIG